MNLPPKSTFAAQMGRPPTEDYLSEWLKERGLSHSSGVFTPDPQGFMLVTHGEHGTAHPELSAVRRASGEPRYKHPDNVGNQPYCAKPESYVRWKNATTKYIPEGHGKTLSCEDTLRLPTIGLSGNWAWHETQAGEKTFPEFRIPHKLIRNGIRVGDTVVIIPDGDWRTNPGVRDGWQHFMEAVRSLGAECFAIDFKGQPAQKLDDLVKIWRDNGLDPIAEFNKLPRLEYLVNWDEPADIYIEFVAPTVKREHLPDVIANYAFEQGAIIGVDPGSIALPAIVTAAALIEEGFEVQPLRTNPTWTEPPILNGANVGDPSSKKSPAQEVATRPAWKVDKETKAAYVIHLTEWELRKAAAGRTFTEPPPVWIRPIMMNTTMEAISELLKTNNRGVLMTIDELVGWFAGFGVYGQSSKRGADRAMALQGYNGKPQIYDRVGRGGGSHPVYCPVWSFSVFGGIQTERLRGEFKNLGDDGMLQRFMLNSSTARVRIERFIDMNVVDAYTNRVAALWRLGEDRPTGRTYTFAEDADPIRRDVFEWADRMILVMEKNSKALGAHIGKMHGLFARLCLVFQLLTDTTGREISKDVALRASRFLREYQLPTLVNFYAMFDGESSTNRLPLRENVQKVADHIIAKRVTRVTQGWLHKTVSRWGEIGDERHRGMILDNLMHLGWLEPIPVVRLGAGRPASKVWAVNPLIHTRYTSKAKELNESMAEIANMYKRTAAAEERGIVVKFREE